MKTNLLSLLFLIITSNAFSQLSKGQFLIGGNISFETTKNEYRISDNNQSTNFFISPDVGYFIIDKLAAGLRFDFASYKSKSGNIESHSNAISFSPFMRYYLLSAAKKINAFIDIGYIHTKTKFTYNAEDYYDRKNGYHISAGPSIFLTDRIALEFTFGFRHTQSRSYDNATANTFNSGLGLQFHLGR